MIRIRLTKHKQFENMANFSAPSLIHKEPWLAVNLSRLLPGLGQIYAHQFLRGAIIFLLSFVSTCIQIVSLFSTAVSLNLGFSLVIFNICLWIWNLFDAHRCASQQNIKTLNEARKQHKDPWVAIFWSSFIPGIGHFYLKKPWLGVLLVILTAFLLWIPIVGMLWTCFVIYLSYIGASSHQPRITKKIFQFIAIFFIFIFINTLTPFLIRTYVAEARYIPSGGMEPALQINDRLIISKLDYLFHGPYRGDITVFNPTKVLEEQGFKDAFIKRVVGVPGDLIELKDGGVYVNNQRLSEPYVANGAPTLVEACGGGLSIEDKTPPPPFLSMPVTIPKNNFFVLGDNRSNSYDGRCWGLVPEQNIIGKATKFFWPLTRMGPVPEVKYPGLPN
jgi:signal peptidase I